MDRKDDTFRTRTGNLHFYSQVVIWGVLVFFAVSGAWLIVLGVLVLSAIVRVIGGSVAATRAGLTRARHDSTAEALMLEELRRVRRHEEETDRSG